MGYGGTGVALSLVCADLVAALALNGRFRDAQDERLLAAITGTKLPMAGMARFAAGVAGGVVAGALRPGSSRR